jgi:hypothetical protein
MHRGRMRLDNDLHTLFGRFHDASLRPCSAMKTSMIVEASRPSEQEGLVVCSTVLGSTREIIP